MKRNLYIIALAIVAVSAIASFLFYRQMRAEKERAEFLKAEAGKVSLKEIEIRKEIKDAKDEKEMLSDALQSESIKVQQMHEDITEVNNTEARLSAQFAEKQKTYSGLASMLDAITQKQSGLDEELKKTKLDYMAVTEQVDYLRKEKKGLEENIRGHIAPPKGVELKKIVVKVSPPVEGAVIEVNKEYSFAIIDLGIEDDIRSGNILAVYRNGNFMAKAVVENVYKDMSSIIVLDEWADVVLAPGDTARLLKP